MLYAWNWWWFMSWIIPMLFLLWVVFGWTGRRYQGQRAYYLGDRDDDLGPGAVPVRDDRLAYNRGRGPKHYRRSDDRILEDICDRLTLDERVDASEVEVSVANATVRLTGYVPTRFERRITESIVDATTGVADVDNQLRVGAPTAGDRGQTAQPPSPVAPSGVTHA